MPQNNETNGNESTKQGQGAKAQGQNKQGAAAATKPAKPAKVKAEKAPKAPKEPKVKAEKPARETPAHMAKVDKIASQLPALGSDAGTLFTAMKNLATADLNGILAHLSVEIRRRGVLAAVPLPGGASAQPASVAEGTRVRIQSGNPRFIGQEGTVAKVQRIRCYVRLDGRDKDDYFFIADVAPLQGSQGQVITASSLAATVSRLTSNPPVVQGLPIHTLVDEDENTGANAATG